MNPRESLFSFLHHSTSVYYLTIDPGSKYTYANRLFITIFGYSSKEIIGKSFLSMIHEEDQISYEEALVACKNEPGSSTSLDLRTPRFDGSLFWTRWEFTALLDDEQKVIGFQCIGNDITERKRAQRERQEAQENLQLLLDNTDESFVMIDTNLNIITYNEAANNISKKWFKEEFKKGKSFLSYSTKNRNGRLPAALKQVLQGKKRESEIQYTEPDGSFVIYYTYFKPVYDDSGKVIRIIITSRDITEKKIAEGRLINNEKHFRALIENSADAITILTEKGIVKDVSPSAEKMLGYSGKEMVKKSLHSLIHPSDKLLFDQTLEKILSIQDGIETIEYRAKTAQGRYKWLSGTYHNLMHEPSIRGIVVNFSDITEKVKTEEKLLQERQLLRTLIDHLPDYIYVKDTKFRHVINNKANVQLIGASSEKETIGKTVMDYFNPSIAQEYINKDRAVLQSGKPVHNMEESITTQKGEKRWLLTTKVPLKDERNEIVGLVGISRDITEQKTIQESLRIVNERYNMVSKATNDAIWDWDLITNEVLWNEGVKYLFGFTDVETTADWWKDRIHPEDRERVISKIRYYIENGIENWQDEYRFGCADGTYKFVFDRGFILFDENEKPYRMIGAMVDTTQLKKLEDELATQKITRQIQITEATIQAQEKERWEIGRELHDNINQILTTTKLYLDMAISEEEIREQLLVKSHGNVSKAIEEIRVLSKALVPPSLGDIGLKEAIDEMITNLNVAQKIRITLKTNISDRNLLSDNIKLMVYRIVQEQMNNIIKHSKATEVDIKLAVSRKILNITVTDNGEGFDLNKKAKGIGLSNIISRAELYNGSVEIHSAPGSGCILKVNIPI